MFRVLSLVYLSSGRPEFVFPCLSLKYYAISLPPLARRIIMIILNANRKTGIEFEFEFLVGC